LSVQSWDQARGDRPVEVDADGRRWYPDQWGHRNYEPPTPTSSNGRGPAEPDAPLATAVVVDVADVKSERVQWLWSGRLARAKVTVLDGDPDQGKSTILTDLFARLTTGSPMPDGEPSDGPRDVVLMSAEDGVADTIRPRLEAAGADLHRVHIITDVTDVDGTVRLPELPRDLPVLEEVIRRFDAVAYGVDVFNAFLSSRVDSYRDQDVRRALHPMKTMSERTMSAGVILRHLSKSAGASALYKGLGSIGVVGAARIGLMAATDPDDDTRRVLAVSKCNLAPKAPSLAYRLVSDELHGAARVEWLGAVEHGADDLLVPGEDRAPRSEAREFLFELLAAGPMSANDVKREARDAGISDATLRRAKSDLRVKSTREGPAGPGGQWTWALPPKVLTDPKDALDANLSTFRSSEHLCRSADDAVALLEDGFGHELEVER
jgi:hypothetical protein